MVAMDVGACDLHACDVSPRFVYLLVFSACLLFAVLSDLLICTFVEDTKGFAI
jgi:hypothetical protein